MPYRYLEDIAIADIAFEAKAETKEGLFIAAGDAVMNVMVEDLNAILALESLVIRVEEEALDMLLFKFLQELIYLKDARRLLLRVSEVDIADEKGRYALSAQAYGEPIDPEKHQLGTDVKAVTLHRLNVERTKDGWQATVVLDI